MPEAERVAVTFRMSSFDAQDPASRYEDGAEGSHHVGDIAEEPPAEKSGEDYHAVVEWRQLRRARIAVSPNNEVLRGRIEHAHAQQQQPLSRV